MTKNEMEAEVAQAFTIATGGQYTTINTTFVSGQEARLFQINTAAGAFFCKQLPVSKFPQLLQHEAEGLMALRAAALPVPEEAFTTTTTFHQYLFTTFHAAKPDTGYWQKAGAALSTLHKVSRTFFGWQKNNYIGLLPQKNGLTNDWISFFRDYRLQPLVQQCTDGRLLPAANAEQFQKLYAQLPNFFELDARPVLLHGDLWRGNLIVHTNGGPLFIDPSVYYGHPAMDLAMTHLFGGFPQQFYTAYREAGGTLPAQETIAVCNLYPLLVHLKLFGKFYLPQIQSTVHRFI